MDEKERREGRGSKVVFTSVALPPSLSGTEVLDHFIPRLHLLCVG